MALFFFPLSFLGSKTFPDLRRSSGLPPCWGGGLQAICLGNGEIEQQMSFWMGCWLCPGWEANCQRSSTGTRTAADSSSAAIEAPALGLGRGWLERGRGLEQSCRVWVQIQVSWLQGLAPGTGARVSQPPLSFIADLKTVLGPQETTRRSLPSFLQEISLQCLFF